jgi:hypothetical protein
VSCRYHLAIEVSAKTGEVRLVFPHVEIADMPETCALDIADRGGVTLGEVAEVTNLSRERIRQLEVRYLEVLRVVGGHLEPFNESPSRGEPPLAEIAEEA